MPFAGIFFVLLFPLQASFVFGRPLRTRFRVRIGPFLTLTLFLT